MTAKPEPPVASIVATVREGCLHGAGSSSPWLALGIDIEGQEGVTVVVDADLAAVLHPGREITLDVRLR